MSLDLAIYEVAGWLLRIVMVPVVLRYRRTPAAAIAWLLLIFFAPFAGAFLYILLGQNSPLRGPRMTHKPEATSKSIQDMVSSAEAGLMVQIDKISGFPALDGNCVDFEGDGPRFMNRLIDEIDGAVSRVYLLFYIFWPDDEGKRVAEALLRARQRGVECRVLVDAVGSRRLFRRGTLYNQLVAAGVEVVAALPIVGLRRRLLHRKDFRNHRKIVVIDSRIAWTGSQNIVGPTYMGKRGVPWIDLMARFEGPVVAQLEAIFLEDWAFEQGEDSPILAPSNEPVPHNSGRSIAQCVATGPQGKMKSFRRIVIAAAHSAQHEIVLSTPYFTPDESTLLALLMAAERGVRVILIVPVQSDLRLADLAGRGYYRLLVAAGCEVYRYPNAILHSKTITVDNTFALCGSANLDVRSFKLNFEAAAVLYDRESASRVRKIQQEYIDRSTILPLAELDRHPRISRLLEELVILLSPLL